MSRIDELMLGEDIDCALIEDAARYFITVDATRKYLSLCSPDEMTPDTKYSFDVRLKSILKAHRVKIENSDEDILSLNEGMVVLYGAYQRAKENNQLDVCNDIADHVKDVAPVYRQKVYSDYVTVSNFIFDAPISSIDTPAWNTLKDVSQSLKKQNNDLKAIGNNSRSIADFWQAVDKYGKDMNVDVRVLPTLKVSSLPVSLENSKVMVRC